MPEQTKEAMIAEMDAFLDNYEGFLRCSHRCGMGSLDEKDKIALFGIYVSSRKCER